MFVCRAICCLLARVRWVRMFIEYHENVEWISYYIKVRLSIKFSIYLHMLTYNNHSIYLSSSISSENWPKPEEKILMSDQIASKKATLESICPTASPNEYWAGISRNSQFKVMYEEILGINWKWERKRLCWMS